MLNLRSATEPNRLGELLLQRKLINHEQLNSAIAEQRQSHQPLGEILVEHQLITRRQMQRSLKWQSIIRLAAVVTSFTLSPLVTAGDFKREDKIGYHQSGNFEQLDQNMASGTQLLGLLLKVNDASQVSNELSHHYGLGSSYEPNSGYPLNASKETITSLVNQLASELNSYIEAPVVTLLKGEYSGGVDSYSEGMVYKAKWSNKGVKLNIKYQF
jgi:hypothetical protein